MEFCQKLTDKLKDETNLRVHFDHRDIRAGKKFYEWEMRGVPLRIEVGPREIKQGKIVVMCRDTLNKETIDYNAQEFVKDVQNILEQINQNLYEKAWKRFWRSICRAGG